MNAFHTFIELDDNYECVVGLIGTGVLCGYIPLSSSAMNSKGSENLCAALSVWILLS